MKKDIISIKDVQFLVDKFYEVVRSDEFLGPIFNSRLDGRWEMHHRKLYRFWHTVLLRRPDYFGDPVPIHFNMSIDERHFDYWLKLWIDTVDENFEGKIADRAKLRGRTMAAAFLSKIKKAEISKKI
jgi:hemoglobin